MTDQTGGDQPQKTVAELLAQHGAQVEGGSRRRRRRAAEDDDEVGTSDSGTGGTGTHRRPGVSDTGSQAIIDRVNADNGTPPARPAAPPPAAPARPAARRRPAPDTPPPAPRAVPQESQQLPRPMAPKPVPPAQQPTRQVPPTTAMPSAPSMPPPPAGVGDSGHFARPMPQESGQYVRPPQEPGQFARPPQEPGQSAQLPVPPRGRPPRQQPTGAQQVPPPPPISQEETRAQVPPVRRRTTGGPQPSQQLPQPPQPSQQLPLPPKPPAAPGGALSARLDGLNGTPDSDIVDLPGPMAGGTFSAPIQPQAPAPGRPRRAPARRPQPKGEAHTEQFAAVPDEIEETPPPVTPPPPPSKGKKPSATPDISSPAGLANWRKRRQKEQMEDTEIGVMPAVPTDDPDGYPPEDDFAPDGFAPEGTGYHDPYDAGPPTSGYPPPMPFAPGDRAARTPVPDDLEEYEREFAEPGGYPDGPDFDRDDYGYEQGEGYEDEYDEDAPEPAAEPAVAASPGKQWLALAGQLAMGVVGGAAVWLGFNWLWVNLPAAALIAALLVVVALVWIVRKIRRAEDLQTTVLAVLVGLVVTVSPAALLLVGR
jgi:hypothetical protein